MSSNPPGFTLVTNPKAPRITPEQVATILRSICKLEGYKKALGVNFRSPPQGQQNYKWMEVRADQYVLAFWLNDHASGGSIANVFFCKTPKGSEWFQPLDNGQPLSLFTPNEMAEINRQLYVGYNESDREVVVYQTWQVGIRTCGSGYSKVTRAFDKGSTKSGIHFPELLGGTGNFESEAEAQRQADAYRKYRTQKHKEESEKK